MRKDYERLSRRVRKELSEAERERLIPEDIQAVLRAAEKLGYRLVTTRADDGSAHEGRTVQVDSLEALDAAVRDPGVGKIVLTATLGTYYVPARARRGAPLEIVTGRAIIGLGG